MSAMACGCRGRPRNALPKCVHAGTSGHLSESGLSQLMASVPGPPAAGARDAPPASVESYRRCPLTVSCAPSMRMRSAERAPGRELTSASFRGPPRRETRRKSRGIAVCVPVRIGLLCVLLAASDLGEHALDRLETGHQAGLLHSL